MEKLSLTQIWHERASANWQSDFDDLNREAAGVQSSRIYRFIAPDTAFITSLKSKEDNNLDILISAYEFTMSARMRAYHKLMNSIDDALKFHDDFADELTEMKYELERFKSEYEKRTIRLGDGRRVYVDENGRYVWQDQYGTWNELEESTIDEAKAKHLKLGDRAITKAQKDNLDAYEAKILYAEATNNQNREQAIEYREASEDSDLTESELKDQREEIEENKNELEGLREELINDQKQIEQNVKADSNLVKQEYSTTNRDAQIFGPEFG